MSRCFVVHALIIHKHEFERRSQLKLRESLKACNIKRFSAKADILSKQEKSVTATSKDFSIDQCQ